MQKHFDLNIFSPSVVGITNHLALTLTLVSSYNFHIHLACRTTKCLQMGFNFSVLCSWLWTENTLDPLFLFFWGDWHSRLLDKLQFIADKAKRAPRHLWEPTKYVPCEKNLFCLVVHATIASSFRLFESFRLLMGGKDFRWRKSCLHCSKEFTIRVLMIEYFW